MSAEIQTSLFIITAEIAGISTVAALAAAAVAWMRGKDRMKAAVALRDAARRLPGEGEIVNKERALLGEFAKAYLTRDAELLSSLPAQLLALRQMHEETQVSHEETVSPQVEEIQARNAALQARAEALEKQQALTVQQLEGSLTTINTLVQEYGRGRGREVTPTSEALLQALLQIGAMGAVVAAVPAEEAAAQFTGFPENDVEVASPGASESSVAEAEGGEAGVVHADEPESELAPEAPAEAMSFAEGVVPEPELAAKPEPEGAPVAEEPPQVEVAQAVASDDIDALLEAVLGSGADAESQPEPEPESEPAPEPLRPVAESVDEDGMDLAEPMVEDVPEAPAQARDDLDDLDIDALLDAEMGRQAKLLQGSAVEAEDLDLAHTEDAPGKP